MKRSEALLAAATGILCTAALVMFQAQSELPAGSTRGLTITGAAGTGTAVFDRTIIGIDGTAVNPTYCFADTNTCFYRGGTSAEDVSIITGGSTRWSLTSSGIVPGANNAYDLGTSAARFKDVYQAGVHIQTWEDDSGTPGNTTCNQRLCRVAVATAATTVVITNSTATASDTCQAVMRAGSNTVCTQVLSCTAAASSVTVVLNGACATAAGVVDVHLVRGAT